MHNVCLDLPVRRLGRIPPASSAIFSIYVMLLSRMQNFPTYRRTILAMHTLKRLCVVVDMFKLWSYVNNQSF
jgi:hypothetical protein